MKINSIVLIVLGCFFSAVCFSQETTPAELSLHELIENYTDEHETNIVFKPSLNPTMKVAKEELRSLDTSTFLDLLTRNGLAAREINSFVFVVPGEDAVPSSDLFQGTWQDGMKSCPGYQTRVETEGFCAESAPESWVPFEFNGRIFYKIPLDGN